MLRKCLVLAAFLGFAGLSANLVKAQQGGGNSQTDAARDIELKWVYNQDAISHSIGQVMVYVGAPTATYPGLSVSTTVTPYDGAFAGIVYDKAIPANSWGFIQTRGYHPSVKIASATVMGDLLWPSATAGSAAAHSGVVVASESCKSFGIALSVNASSTSIPAVIR